MIRFATLVIAALLITLGAHAENGKIAGKISDKTYGEPVIGATIAVQGLSIGTVTDVDGNFQLSVPTGEYVIEIKYVGYQQKNIEGVVIKAGQTTEVVAVLEENESTKLNEVVVTARLDRETVNALYIQQRNNVSLSSGISADIIQRSPDKNTGEVLKRVSGASMQEGKYAVIRGLNDRYNMAMVNNALMSSTEPDRKAFSFDVIPSNVIDNIIINKTATPDMPGDFAGGVVKVLTKDVPEKDFITVGITAGMNTQTTFKDFKSTERGGLGYFGFPSQDHELSSAFGPSKDEYKAMPQAKRLEAAQTLPNNSFKTNTTSAMPNTSLNVSAGKSYTFKNGDKVGIVAAVNTANRSQRIDSFRRGKYLNNGDVHTLSNETQYKQESNTAALLNLAYTKGKSRISLKNLYNKMYDHNYTERLGYSTSSNQESPLYFTMPSDRSILNSQLEGSHAIGTRNVKVEWNLNYSNMRAYMHDFRTAEYQRGADGGFDGNPTISTDPYSLVDRDSRRFFSDQFDDNVGGNASVTYPFEIAGRKQSIKAGYFGLIKDRVFNARVFQHQFADTDPTNPAKDPLYHQSVETIFNSQNYNKNGFELLEITSNTDRYDAGATLHAGFVMADNTVGSKLRIIWGARYESYTQKLLAKDRAGKVIDRSTPFNDFLPSANITLDVNDKQKVRAAVSRTVNRPEFREIAPFGFIDYQNVWSVVGNDSLIRANITNYDLRYEIYPNPGEVISVGAFYKDFTNPIEFKMDDQSNLDFLIFTYQNASSAYAAGLEFEARKKLGFLGGAAFLDDITAATNLTYIYSRVAASSIIGGQITTVGTKTERPLQGQSPYIINFSLMYAPEKSNWAISALYNRIGHRIAVVGNASIPTTWENGRNIVDMQVSKKVLKGKGEFKLTASNLLNAPVVKYWNNDTKDAYKKGDSITGQGNDLIFQKYRLGTGISVGFRYTID